VYKKKKEEEKEEHGRDTPSTLKQTA